MKKLLLLIILSSCSHTVHSWGFYAHRQINYYAVFMLPPEMLVLYKPNLAFLTDHAVDPDKRRYAVAAEGARHYIDIEHYGVYPFDSLPRTFSKAIEKYGKDTLQAYALCPGIFKLCCTGLPPLLKKKTR